MVGIPAEIFVSLFCCGISFTTVWTRRVEYYVRERRDFEESIIYSDIRSSLIFNDRSMEPRKNGGYSVVIVSDEVYMYELESCEQDAKD